MPILEPAIRMIIIAISNTSSQTRAGWSGKKSVCMAIVKTAKAERAEIKIPFRR